MVFPWLYLRLTIASVSGRIVAWLFAHANNSARFLRGDSISRWICSDGPFMGYCFLVFICLSLVKNCQGAGGYNNPVAVSVVWISTDSAVNFRREFINSVFKHLQREDFVPCCRDYFPKGSSHCGVIVNAFSDCVPSFVCYYAGINNFNSFWE